MTLVAPLTDVADDLLENPALIYVGTSCIGATRDGVSWDPGTTYADIAVDGVKVPVQGLTRITGYQSKLTFNLIQLGTAAEIQKLEHSATTATSTDTNITTVVSMKDAGELLATGDYLTDVRAIWSHADGTYTAIYLPLAYVSKRTITGAADGEATIPIELTGCNTTANVNKAPYKYELRSGLPA